MKWSVGQLLQSSCHQASQGPWEGGWILSSTSQLAFLSEQMVKLAGGQCISTTLVACLEDVWTWMGDGDVFTSCWSFSILQLVVGKKRKKQMRKFGLAVKLEFYAVAFLWTRKWNQGPTCAGFVFSECSGRLLSGPKKMSRQRCNY